MRRPRRLAQRLVEDQTRRPAGTTNHLKSDAQLSSLDVTASCKLGFYWTHIMHVGARLRIIAAGKHDHISRNNLGSFGTKSLAAPVGIGGLRGLAGAEHRHELWVPEHSWHHAHHTRTAHHILLGHTAISPVLIAIFLIGGNPKALVQALHCLLSDVAEEILVFIFTDGSYWIL
jgi:hypothetical protein